MELHSESENFSICVKEMLSFINEKGLMDECTSKQASQRETKFLEKGRKNSENQDKAFSAMLKSALLQFTQYKRLFNKRNSEEMILLFTSGKHTEFIARVESRVGKKKVGGKK